MWVMVGAAFIKKLAGSKKSEESSTCFFFSKIGVWGLKSHPDRCNLPTPGPLVVVFAASRQWNYGGGTVGVAVLLGDRRPQMQQPTIVGRSEGGWWLWSRRLTGGNGTTSRGGQEREAAAQ